MFELKAEKGDRNNFDQKSKRKKVMNCATMMPEERYFYARNNNTSGHDRRVSRGLASCLRGETEECLDYEAEGNSFLIDFLLNLMLTLPFFHSHVLSSTFVVSVSVRI